MDTQVQVASTFCLPYAKCEWKVTLFRYRCQQVKLKVIIKCLELYYPEQ
jgi:hypothetical protein